MDCHIDRTDESRMTASMADYLDREYRICAVGDFWNEDATPAVQYFATSPGTTQSSSSQPAIA
jgi:hypothetical protein